MKIALWVDKEAALRSGRDEHGWVVVDIPAAEISENDRDTITSHKGLTSRVNDKADFLLEGKGYVQAYQISVANRETLHLACEAIREEDAKREAEEAAQRQERIAESIKRLRAYLANPEDEYAPWTPAQVGDNSEELNQLYAQVAEVRHKLEAKWKAEAEERERVAEVQKKLAEERKTEQLRALVERLGTDNQKARLAEGLLPASEGWGLLEAEEEKRLEGFAFVEESAYLVQAEIDCKAEYSCEGECDRDTDKIEKLSAAEYDNLAKLRKALPADAEIELFRDTVKCSCGAASDTQVGAKASWRVGEYVIVRNVAL